MNAIQIDNLSKEIKGISILQNINIAIQEGLICGLVGRNASGKSMLFKCVVDLNIYNTGKIQYFGKHREENLKWRDDVSALIEYPGFISNLSGYQNLKLLSSIRNTADDKHIKNLMLELGLDPDDKKVYKKYSLGMRQKLGVVSALMEKSKLIILDEPTNNVDEDSAKTIIELIKRFNKEYRITFFITSHNMEEIVNVCDKIYVIENGIVAERKIAHVQDD